MSTHRPLHSHQLEPLEQGEGGGYLASTADLMIGVLFIFIILVVILAIKLQDSDEAPPDPRTALTLDLGRGMTGKFPGIRIEAETGVISLPEDVLFATGKADLSQEGRAVLAEVAAVLAERLPCYVENQRRRQNCRSNPENHQVETIFIEGHTDNVPYPIDRLACLDCPRDNFELSLKRARSVEQALVTEGLKEFRNRANQPLFSLSAYADTRPIKGVTPDSARNRRVDLRLILHYQAVQQVARGTRVTVQPPYGAPR